MTTTTTVNAAIIGTGFMSWVHVEALRRIGINVHGILGSTPEKSRRASKELGIPQAYDSLDDLCNDQALDSAHVASPNYCHVDQVEALIRSDKHVLCEKPLAIDSSESRRLVELANQNLHLQLGVNYNIRFYPLCHESRARITAREFGNIFHVTGHYLQDWLIKSTDYNWRVDDHEGGPLRAVADIGTHWFDLVQFATGQRITSVCACLSTIHTQRERQLGRATFSDSDSSSGETERVDVTTEDCGSIMFRLESGALGQLFVSQVAAGRKNALRFEIAGPHSNLEWNSESPNELWIGYRDRPNEKLTRDPALLSESAAKVASYPGGHNEGYDDSFKQCFQAFYNDVRDETDRQNATYPSFENGHHEILLCEAIARSHQAREWVQVEQ